MVALPFCHFELKASKPLPPEYPRELKTLGDYLRKKRLDLGIYQKQAAEIIGTNATTIWDWENNRTQPDLEFIPQIIAFLRYNPYENISNLSLGERIIAYRQAHGITQKALAHQLGIDPGTLGRWEKNESTPWQEKANVLNSLFGTISTAIGRTE